MSTSYTAAPPPTRLPPCWGCIALALGVVAAVTASFAYLAVDYRQLFSNESMRLMAKFVAEFFPPDVAPAFLAKAAWGALQTFAVATIGTLLAVGFGAAIALPAAGRFGLAPRLAARLLLNFLRSVPELVWAALMVIAAGLGPFAGTLALALHTTGVLGRLYAESLENVPPAPERALRESGSGRIAAFAYATLPLVTAQELASYTVYRWECAVRASVVMGFVGAGGLGQLMDQSMKMLNGGEASTILLTFLALVIVADAMSAVIRRVVS